MGDGEMPQLRQDLLLHRTAHVKPSAPLTALASGQLDGFCHRFISPGNDPLTFGCL